MFDRDTLIISYDTHRGEPRRRSGARPTRRRSQARRLRVDCIAVRAGLPDRHRHPQGPAVRVHRLRCLHRRLQRRHGQARLPARADPLRDPAQPGRRRRASSRRGGSSGLRKVLVYATVLILIGGAFVASLALRLPLRVDVVRDRGSLARVVEDGRIENVYRLQVMNTTEAPQQYRISVSGDPGVQASTRGGTTPRAGRVALGFRSACRSDRRGTGARDRRTPDRVPHHPARVGRRARGVGRREVHIHRAALEYPMSKPDRKSKPWWRYSIMWLVVGGPLTVVVAAVGTAVIAVRGADPVLQTEDAREVRSSAPAPAGAQSRCDAGAREALTEVGTRR